MQVKSHDFENTYKNLRVFLTGHTGFKGTWLAQWLEMLGAKTSGFALEPNSSPSHFERLRPKLEKEFIHDIRDFEFLERFLRNVKPDLVFHLAAQPVVRISYRNPLETFSTNIQGSANLLEACRRVSGIRAVVVITSDKCYRNDGRNRPFRENDRLGAHDPYSASKACAEMIVESFRSSYPEMPLLATARAGNVIGGGDWSEDRLIPDLIRAAETNSVAKIRMPHAVRPWQHVLEPLAGYLLLGRKLLEGRREFAGPWNFGPEPEGHLSVAEIVRIAAAHWDRIRFEPFSEPDAYREAASLTLDCVKAKTELDWKPRWNSERAIARTIQWYKTFYETGRLSTREQIEEYFQ